MARDGTPVEPARHVSDSAGRTRGQEDGFGARVVVVVVIVNVSVDVVIVDQGVGWARHRPQLKSGVVRARQGR